MSKVAILITTYNRLNLLKRTLESLHESLKNDKNDVTIFIVDDGSTDGTIEFLRSFTLPHPRIFGYETIYHKKNMGLRTSLNDGLRLISKEDFDYISYNQDDVEFKEGWLQECIDWWERSKMPNGSTQIGFITGHDAPEHPTIYEGKDFKIKPTCRATHLFASAKRWKEFGEIPDLTPGIASPKPGQGSMCDWWLVGHPDGKYPESRNSLRKRGEKVLVLPGRIKHIGVEESTWGNIMNPEY